MLDNPRGENRRRLPIRSPGVLGYCQGSFQCCHWYCQSFFKVGIDIFNDIFKVVIGIFEVVNCSLFTNLTTFPTKVLGIERKVIGQHHASAVLYEHRFIQNKQQVQYWPWLLTIITLKIPSEMEVALRHKLLTLLTLLTGLILLTWFTLLTLFILFKLLHNYTA